MALYSSGNLAIAVCDRCNFKTPYNRLRPDGDAPGLRVCDRPGCWDRKDPWKLGPRGPDQIALHYPRPDVPFTTDVLADNWDGGGIWDGSMSWDNFPYNNQGGV